jgi:predicted phage terminase large subunit-like protein
VAQKIAAATQKSSPRSVISRLAQERLYKLQSSKIQLNTKSLVEFIPQVSPDLKPPYHLLPFVRLLEGACEPGKVRAVLAAPPQHGKSVTLLHGLLWLCIKYPKVSHAYVTYATDRAETVSKQFTELAEAAGMEPKGRLSDVVLKGGSTVKFTSIGGVLTGYPVTGLLIIDDPVKDRADAESPTLRRKAIEWFIDVARSRRHPKTSIICMATRWHPEDLSGELLKRVGKNGKQEYSYLNFKAISEGVTDDNGIVIGDPLGRRPGEALFPELKPVEFFDEERQDDYSWQSLYQGEPRGRGNTVFRYPDMGLPSTYCSPRFAGDYERISIGLDFAYTAKTSADYSAAVVIGDYKGELHIIDTLRLQVEPRDFRDRVRLLLATYPGATATAYVAATEKGGVEFFRDGGLDIDGLIAKQDKFMRAVPTAAAWNSGRFKLQAGADWTNTFINEICGFTGIKDRHDDLVDAFAAAYDGLGAPPATYRPAIHTRIVGETAHIGLG